MSVYSFLFTFLFLLQINLIICQNNNIIGTTSKVQLKKSHIVKRDLSTKDYDQYDIIDVASFIQKPDYYPLSLEDVDIEQDNSQDNTEGIQPEVVEEVKSKTNDNINFINHNVNDNLKESINDEINDMISRNGFVNNYDHFAQNVHSDYKKAISTDMPSGYKGIKFPFFSSNKIDRKVKKKSKHSIATNGNDDAEEGMTQAPFTFHKKKKRSHSDSCKCKSCKKRRYKKRILKNKLKRNKLFRQRNKQIK